MSEVKLNLIDNHHVLHGEIHGSVADACVAALSAEPETTAELSAALARFIKPLDPHCPFATFHSSVHSTPNSANITIDTEPWDAGIVIIDLAARIVASESTYSQPDPEGNVDYHDGTKSTDISLPYRLPGDWLFVNSVEAYQWSRERRARDRLAQTPLDVREVLYGTPLLEFIVDECAKIDISEVAANETGTTPHAAELVSAASAGSLGSDSIAANAVLSTSGQTAEASDSRPNLSDAMVEALSKEISAIHARWLMTPREDLRGQSPRDVLFAKRDFIDFDLHTRSLQWSMLDEGPPCLSPDSFAYRFAGFGTHEWVIYYDLIRDLLWTATSEDFLSNASSLWSTAPPESQATPLSAPAWAIVGPGDVNTQAQLLAHQSPPSSNETLTHQVRETLIAHLDKTKTAWLEQPQSEYDGRTPAILIDNERKRLPIALRPHDMIIDEDCPMCQMFGDETSPLGMGVGFWCLDGSHMDDDFAFSPYETREEWETENRNREEFNKEFDRKWTERQERIARGEPLEPDPYFDSDPF